MSGIRHFLAVALCAAGVTATGVLAQEAPTTPERAIRIDLADGAGFAQQLLRAGQPRAALQVAQALLQADPEDSQAHVIVSQAQLRLGNISEARKSARAGWRTAQGNRERFAAAFTMADALAADEAYTRSQIWIRRAIQAAPGPQSEAIAIEAFRRVRLANPLAVELGFGLTPSSNVNSGNSNEAINFAYLPGVFGEILWQVPPDQRPLSGVEVSLQADLRYRIAATQTSRTSLEFGAFGRSYLMSDSARASAPDVTGKSLSYVRLSFGVLHQWVPRGGENPYSASLTYSYDWAGGDPVRHEISGTLGTQFELSETDTLAVSATARFSNTFSSNSDVATYSLRGRWAHALENEDVFGVTAQLAHASSHTTDLSYDEATLGLSYDFGDVLPGVDLSTSWTEQLRIYETSVFDPAGRNDRTSSLQLDVGLQDVEFYGFEPVVTLSARRTDSSVPRFDTEGAQIGINLRSSF